MLTFINWQEVKHFHNNLLFIHFKWNQRAHERTAVDLIWCQRSRRRQYHDRQHWKPGADEPEHSQHDTSACSHGITLLACLVSQTVGFNFRSVHLSSRTSWRAPTKITPIWRIFRAFPTLDPSRCSPQPTWLSTWCQQLPTCRPRKMPFLFCLNFTPTKAISWFVVNLSPEPMGSGLACRRLRILKRPCLGQ